jgi:hypothetical protein
MESGRPEPVVSMDHIANYIADVSRHYRELTKR